MYKKRIEKNLKGAKKYRMNRRKRPSTELEALDFNSDDSLVDSEWAPSVEKSKLLGFTSENEEEDKNINNLQIKEIEDYLDSEGENDDISTPIPTKSWTEYVERYKQISFTGTDCLTKDFLQHKTPLFSLYNKHICSAEDYF